MRTRNGHDKVGGGGSTHCGSCGDVLLGEAIKVASNLHFHVQCFLCTACGCELVNTGFFSKLAKYYCAEDYHTLFGTRCSLCCKYIEGEGLSVQGKGKSYHISCLTCSRCGGKFDEGSRITFEKDQALCDSCKVTTVTKAAAKHVCAACHQSIVGTSIFAMEQEWHMSCFNCEECKKPLTGEYMCKDGIPFCEQDYQRLYGQCCNICSEFILGKVLQAGGNSYHTSCLKCYICTQQFEEGQEIFMQDELFWHTDCDEAVPVEYSEPEDAPLPPEVAEQQEKEPPSLILPPPPDTTPPPDTPDTSQQVPAEEASSNLAVVGEQDTNKSSASIASDYEELTILQEAGKTIVTDSDFEELPPAKPSRGSSIKSEKSEKSTSIKSGKSSSVESNKLEQQPASKKIPTASSGSIDTSEEHRKSLTTSETPNSTSTKERSGTGASESSLPDQVFSDVSEKVIPDIIPAVPVQDDALKQSDSSSYVSDKENQKQDKEEEVEEERCLSVKEALQVAQEKERRAAIGDAVLMRNASSAANKGPDSIKKFLSTDSDRSSESSDPPSKPPRTRSPCRTDCDSRKSSGTSKPPAENIVHKGVIKDQGVLTVTESPPSALRGLRSVDSPILKLLDDLDKKDDEQIDYLELQETYDLSVLQTEKIRLPKGIDRSQLQRYLTQEQFQAAFKMPIESFDKLPAWKKTNLKKSLNLF